MQKSTTAGPSRAPTVSIIVPVYNEEENIPLFLQALLAAIDKLPTHCEVIAVDDGSSDNSYDLLKQAAAKRPELKIIQFRRNAGQTAAMMAGIDHAAGDVVVTIDADLQNDPEDLVMILDKLAEGYDVVSGWRQDRQDSGGRVLMSRVANRLISYASDVKLHDYGCTLKAYRKEVLEGMRLYGEMHRFVPIYATWMGAKVAEVTVRHHPRSFGKSKYGMERTLKVLLDLLVVSFFSRYLVKPMDVFGGFGALAFAGSLAAFSYMLYLKFFQATSMIQTPLPVLTAMLFLVGAMSILMGFLAEILVRTYFESRGRPPYYVRSKINFDQV